MPSRRKLNPMTDPTDRMTRMDMINTIDYLRQAIANLQKVSDSHRREWEHAQADNTRITDLFRAAQADKEELSRQNYEMRPQLERERRIVDALTKALSR